MFKQPLLLLLLALVFASTGLNDRDEQTIPTSRNSPPAPPVNLGPFDGSTMVESNPLLCVDVSDPDGDPLTVEFFGRDITREPAADFTVIALPDTQQYSLLFPYLFDLQTQWIVSNKDALNIAFTTHVGDIVSNSSGVLEWDIASAAMGFLEDPVTTELIDGIPYGMCLGNHDNNRVAGTLEDQGSATVEYNQAFGVDRFAGRAYYGGHFGVNNDNTYQLFSASGMDFIVIHLEWDHHDSELRAVVLEWADDLLKTHSDRRAIVTGHYLLDPDGSFGEQGQATFDALKDNLNLFLMLCGHLWNNPHRTDVHEGNTIHSLMSNYQQALPNGGNGWLRIMTFSPSSDEIRVETYSPWLDDFMTDSQQQFTLEYDMERGWPFQSIGTVGAAMPASPVCLNWPGLEDGHEYEWFVRVTDGASTADGPAWGFVSNGSCLLQTACDDGNACTSDRCKSNACEIERIPGCCENDSECDDDNLCTDDTCLGGVCVFPNNAGPCTDGDACTGDDTCSFGMCFGTPLDCDDGNACTSNQCVAGECLNDLAATDGCCTMNEDCADADPCTDDSCIAGNCVNVPDPSCCAEDIECDDDDACTTDFCSRNQAGIFLDGSGSHVTMGTIGQVGMNNQGLNAAEFTIELWFKWDGGGQTTTTARIDEPPGIQAYPLIAKGRGMTDNNVTHHINYFLGIHEPGHVLAADFEEHRSGTTQGLNHPVLGETPVSTGAWHHAAATYDGSCWELYLDGQPETDGANCPGEPPNFESDEFFSVGTGQDYYGNAEGAFSGLLDEVRVWNRALSQAEIQANMQMEIEILPDLLGRWGFEDGAGYDAVDTSGNGNDGNLILAEWQAADLPPLGSGTCETWVTLDADGLVLDNPSGVTTLQWSFSGPWVRYDVASGLLVDLHAEQGAITAQCLFDNVEVTSFVDDVQSDPLSGEGYYYLIRSEGTCSGSYGTTSSGAERLPVSPCP